MLHDEDLGQAIIDRVLERGRLIRLDGPSIRTLHLKLDETLKDESDQDDEVARISGNKWPEFPEPTTMASSSSSLISANVREAARRTVSTASRSPKNVTYIHRCMCKRCSWLNTSSNNAFRCVGWTRDNACTAAGVPGRLLHDMRRSAVRNLERDGVSRSAAMAMVGDRTEAIYRRYAIVDAGALRDAAAKIDRAAGGFW